MSLQWGAVFSQAYSGTDADAIRRWATTAEQAGLEHILAYDHVLGASVERLGPGPFGNFPAAPYTDQHIFHEILTLFSHLAAITTTINFVTSVLVLPQRQAALAAKQIATIDRLSGGRLRVAVGVGWNRAEYEGLGVDFARRTAILIEQMEVMRRLWRDDLVTYDGEFHRLDRVGINPRPDRTIPLWIGTGTADPALRRVVAHADGWMPLILPTLDPLDLPSAVRRIRQLCEEAGRDPASLPIHGRVFLHDGWLDDVEVVHELGCSHCSIGFNRMAEPGRSHAEHLDAIIAAVGEVRRRFGS